MIDDRRPSAGTRAVAFLVVTALPVTGLWLAAAGYRWWSRSGASLSAASVSMDDALVVGAAATGALVCAYLTLGTAVTLADATGRFSRRWVPVWWRGAVSAAFSVGLTATLVAPASAVSSGDDAGWVARPAAGKVEQSTPVRDSWLAGKSQAIMTAQGLAAGIPTTPLAPAEPTPNGQPAGAAEGVHVVVTGDTLWDITATYLGENASDTEIASAWPQLYQLNRDVIGDDPGVILPRQVLALPTEWQS